MITYSHFKSSFIVSIFLAMLLNVSCSKDEDGPTEINLTANYCDNTHLDCQNYYPLKVGNYWKYSDGRKLEITGTSVIDGKTYYEFTQTGTPDTYSWYDRVENSSVYEIFESYDEILWMALGADLDYEWDRTDYGTGTITTILESKTDEIMLGTTTFSNAYTFSFSYSAINRYGTVTFLPGIGYVAQQVYNNDVIWGDETYELIEFKIDGRVYLLSD